MRITILVYLREVLQVFIIDCPGSALKLSIKSPEKCKVIRISAMSRGVTSHFGAQGTQGGRDGQFPPPAGHDSGNSTAAALARAPPI